MLGHHLICFPNTNSRVVDVCGFGRNAIQFDYLEFAALQRLRRAGADIEAA